MNLHIAILAMQVLAMWCLLVLTIPVFQAVIRGVIHDRGLVRDWRYYAWALSLLVIYLFGLPARLV